MKLPSLVFRSVAGAAAGIALLSGGAGAQPAPTPSAPAWTGARLPFAQHLSVMILHLDDAALAMARQAQTSAKSESTKKLAADVVAARTSEIAALRSQYERRYGQAPPAWPAPRPGYGPGMMGGAYGPGMMRGGYGGPGMMRGGYGPGMMIGYGDAYQMMMGGRSNWWTNDSDTGFVPALIRLDAMQVSMATFGLTGDEANASLARRIVSARTTELSRLAGTLPS